MVFRENGNSRPGLHSAPEEPGANCFRHAPQLGVGVAVDVLGRLDFDRNILRLAVYELRSEPETPHAVIINEALELAHTYSTDEAVKFINGVLDGIRKQIPSRSRSSEN